MSRKTNLYIDEKNWYAIALYHPNSFEIIEYTYISKQDYPKTKGIFWRLSNCGYARGWDSKNKREVLLHCLILNSDTKKQQVDHIDRNKLNNIRENLRIVPARINALNRGLQKNSTTKYKSVSYDIRRHLYRAYIRINQKQIWLGYHSTKADAYEARINYEKKSWFI